MDVIVSSEYLRDGYKGIKIRALIPMEVFVSPLFRSATGRRCISVRQKTMTVVPYFFQSC